MIQKYIIYGKPITKKNSPRIGYVGAHCPVCHKGKYAKVLPSAAYLKYARTAKMFLKPAPKIRWTAATMSSACTTCLHAARLIKQTSKVPSWIF